LPPANRRARRSTGARCLSRGNIHTAGGIDPAAALHHITEVIV